MVRYESQEAREARDAKKVHLGLMLAFLLYTLVQLGTAIGWIHDKGTVLISMYIGALVWIPIAWFIFENSRGFAEKSDAVILLCVTVATVTSIAGIFWETLRPFAFWFNVLPGAVIFGVLAYLYTGREE